MASHAQNIPYRPTWSLYHHHSRCTSLTPFCSFIYLFHLVFAVLVGFYLLYIPSSRALVVYYSHDNVASTRHTPWQPSILYLPIPISTFRSIFPLRFFLHDALPNLSRAYTPFPAMGESEKGEGGERGGERPGRVVRIHPEEVLSNKRSKVLMKRGSKSVSEAMNNQATSK